MALALESTQESRMKTGWVLSSLTDNFGQEDIGVEKEAMEGLKWL